MSGYQSKKHRRKGNTVAMDERSTVGRIAGNILSGQELSLVDFGINPTDRKELARNAVAFAFDVWDETERQFEARRLKRVGLQPNL